MRNKEMGSYKASRIFNIQQTTLERYVKDRQKSSIEAINTKPGMKQVLRCEAETDLAEHCLLMERHFFFRLDNGRRHASRLPTCCKKQKHQVCKRNENAGRKWLRNFLRRHQEISVRTLEGLSLWRAKGFTPESVAQFFFLNLRTRNGHHST